MVRVKISYVDGTLETVECSYAKPREGFFLLAQTDKHPLKKFRWIPSHVIKHVDSESDQEEDDDRERKGRY